jgi:hypothetical protein
VNDEVDRFSILIEGADFIDYVADPNYIEDFSPRKGEIEDWDLIISPNYGGKDKIDVSPTHTVADYMPGDSVTLTRNTTV